MTNVLVAGAPATIAANRRPIEERRMPPLVGNRHRPGGSLLSADACLGLLLCRDADLCLLIIVELHLL
jgi:hypothetical protein